MKKTRLPSPRVRVFRAAALVFALAVAFPAPARPPAPTKFDANGSPGDVYFKQITLDEAAQFISQIGKTSIVVTASVASKKVSLYLRDVNVEGMVKSLCRAAGVWYRFDAQTKTYILMDAKEYQQDIAITRDETTRSYALRHHNVVSIANAIAALFGDRVNLVEPVEEMPPVDMGGTGRSQGGGLGGSYGGNGNGGGSGNWDGSGNRNNGGNVGGGSFGRSFSAEGAISRRSGGSSRSGQASQTDARKEIAAAVSQAGLEAALDVDSVQAEKLDASEILAAANKGPAINITYNKLHNLLLVRTSDEAALKEIDKFVADMDLPPRQVLLEMRILEVELGRDFRSVFDIGASGNSTSRAPSELGVGSGLSGTTNDRGEYPRVAGALGNFAAEVAPTAIWQLVNDNLRLRLQLLEGENRVNVLATPMLVAANNQPARLFIGDEQVLVTGASSDSVTGTTGATNTTVTVETEQRNVGQTLIVLPRINADRSVTLTIDQDNSRIVTGGATMPLALANGQVYQFPIDTVNTANLQVTAHARDGLTVAVGGMISQRVTDGEEKVPLLGDVPILGHLFKKTVRENTRRQLVLLITPHILETPEESDALARDKEDALRQMDASGTNRSAASKFRRDSIFSPASGLAPAAPQPENGAVAASDLERLTAIARAAADAVRRVNPEAAHPASGLAPAPSRPSSAWRRLSEDLECQALYAWQKDGYYVTAVRVINLGGHTAAFEPTLIAGRWAAVVAERRQLDPAGGEASWTWVYAISRQPYEQAVERP
ncbi:MAG: DUF3438 family protein [Azoarcus sp.]|nr:DUF3438 family protein [Azoarcus sp.]